MTRDTDDLRGCRGMWLAALLALACFWLPLFYLLTRG